MRQHPALERALARPHDVGDEVLEPERVELVGWIAGFSPVRTSSSLTPRRAAWSIRRSTSSGWCRCGLCVANEQYLQWALHVRESESVTLREKVTRRIRSPRYRCASPASSCVAALALAGCGGTQSTSSFGDVPLVLGDTPGADEAGVFLATARGYDEAEGVTLNVARSGDADFRLVGTPPSAASWRGGRGCVVVMADRAAGQARALRRRDHAAGRAPEGAGGRPRSVARLHAGADWSPTRPCRR